MSQSLFRNLVLMAVCASAAWCENGLTRRERKEGFELLFDGKSLDHWRAIKPASGGASWQVRKGILTWNKSGGWLATEETFYDFVLRLDYRTSSGSDSGIYLRGGEEGNPAMSGMKLVIRSDSGKPADSHSTGAIFGVAAPSSNMAKPDGEWNQVEVSLIRRALIADWNGQRVLDVNLDDPKYQTGEHALADRLTYGHIGIDASSAAPVEFRNMRLRVAKAGRHLK